MVSSFVSILSRGLAAGLLTGVLTMAASAQERPRLDVPFVPTPPEVVAKMMELGRVTKNDFVLDLGSGDGRIAIAAARIGARAMGVDIDPERIREATENAKKAGVSDRVTFRQQNLFNTNIGEATVLTMYLLTHVNLELRPRVLKELPPGRRVVSHAFDMGDWKPDMHEKVAYRDVYLWIVPAEVEGRWQVSAGGGNFSVDIKQRYQQIEGSANVGSRSVPIGAAKLNGADIEFTVEGTAYRGKVSGNTIEGAAPQGWRATRGS